MNNVSDLWPEGRNLLRYDREECILSDFHSPVAVGSWDADQLGVTQLFFQAYAPTATKPVLDPLLRIFVRDEQATSDWQPVAVSERTCWPGGWIETGCASDVTVTQQVWFRCHNQLQIHIEVTPRAGTSGRQIQLALGGGQAASPVELDAEASGDGVCVGMQSEQKNEDGDPEFVGSMELCTAPSPKSVRFRRGPSHNSTPPKPEELSDTDELGRHMGYWIELPSVSCESGNPGTTELTFGWTFSGASAPEQKHYGFVENVKRWQTMIQSLPLPEDNMYWRRKGALAIAGLYESLIQSPGYGNMEDKLGIGARTLDHLSHSYFWDSMTTVPVLARLNPDWGAEIIENFTQHIGNHDCPPFAISAFPTFKGEERHWRGSQAPIASWAVQKLVDCTEEQTELTARLYPELAKINDSWFEHATRGDCDLPMWMNTGACADDSPLYDQYAGTDEGWHNIYLPPIASVSLCSYLLMDLKCLSRMAQTLDKEQDAARWDGKAESLETTMLELLWHDDEKIFYDRDLTTHRPTKVKTFFNLLPLWAGIGLPEADARAAIQQHLLNEDEMWGEVPFPSVAYNEPEYDPDGYWRGRCWPHIYFWNTEILSKYGFEREAEEAKRRFMSTMADAIELPENFVSSALPANRRERSPHYAWGMATQLFFLWDWHLQPV